MYFQKFEIQTENCLSENLKILDTIVCIKKMPILSFNFDYENKPFWGKIKGNEFGIIPAIEGKNSFMPIIQGKISDEAKSKITITMRLHMIMIFILFLFLGLIIILLQDGEMIFGLIPLFLFIGFGIFEYLRLSKIYRNKLENYFKHKTNA
jgi:hypothetical protein